MPNFPPGSPNNVSVTPINALVFTPTPGVQASVRLWNPGTSTVYVGVAGLTPANGLPILPGNRPIELQNINVPLYACSGVSSLGAPGTVATATAAGVTSLTVATVAPTANTYLKYGNGSSVEYVLVSAVAGAASPWTATTSATLLDHGANSTAATAVAVPGPLSVQAGVG